jgi:hypothetical protein
MTNIVAVEFANLSWMTHQSQFASAIFIYIDTEERTHSTDDDHGYMEISKMNGTRSFPISVCSHNHGCYSCLNPFTRQMIDICFRRISNKLNEGPFDTVFFSVTDYQNVIIDVREHAFIGNDVVNYIMLKIKSLSTENIKMMIKQNRHTI